MRADLLLIAMLWSSGASTEPFEPTPADFKVPCVLRNETWVCAGELSERPACIDIDANRMVCTGTPMAAPYRETRTLERPAIDTGGIRTSPRGI